MYVKTLTKNENRVLKEYRKQVIREHRGAMTRSAKRLGVTRQGVDGILGHIEGKGYTAYILPPPRPPKRFVCIICGRIFGVSMKDPKGRMVCQGCHDIYRCHVCGRVLKSKEMSCNKSYCYPCMTKKVDDYQKSIRKAWWEEVF